MSTRIIISISSDIGFALASHWLKQGHRVLGTFRTQSDELEGLEEKGAHLVYCDLGNRDSVIEAADVLLQDGELWDVLVVAAGAQDPVGPFMETDFDAWGDSVTSNFTGQMRILHALLPKRNQSFENEPLALFFAGGGTNNATLNYSAYTLSKVALTKACELLDAEIPGTRFAILGPGWVRTKIHEATLAARDRAGANYERTLMKLKRDEFVPMQAVLDCCDWFVNAPRAVVGGRNISLVYDRWGNPDLDELLRQDSDMYKLRRAGNDSLVRTIPISEADYAAAKT